MVDPQVMSTQEYMANDTCNGWVEIALDVFVTTKAIVLVYMCGHGILWFLKRNFYAITVIIILLVSCTLVSSVINSPQHTLSFVLKLPFLQSIYLTLLFVLPSGNLGDGLQVHKSKFALQVHSECNRIVASLQLSNCYDRLCKT